MHRISQKRRKMKLFTHAPCVCSSPTKFQTLEQNVDLIQCYFLTHKDKLWEWSSSFQHFSWTWWANLVSSGFISQKSGHEASRSGLQYASFQAPLVVNCSDMCRWQAANRHWDRSSETTDLIHTAFSGFEGLHPFHKKTNTPRRHLVTRASNCCMERARKALTQRMLLLQINERFHDPLFHTQLDTFRLDGMPDVPQVNTETMDPRGEAVSFLLPHSQQFCAKPNNAKRTAQNMMVHGDGQFRMRDSVVKLHKAKLDTQKPGRQFLAQVSS